MSIDLFPVPTALASPLCPRPLFGISYESTETLRNALKDNHERWHVYYKVTPTIAFHNHSAHYLLALWALGAEKEAIQAAYDLDCTYQLPTIHSPETITAENFKDHLGDAKYYEAYRKYFTDILQTQDIATVVEEFIFDLKMNFDGSSDPPEMLTRFWDGLVHPMIHIGYGAEFGLPGIIVEGLASTAVHTTIENVLIPKSLWEPKRAAASSAKNVHALTILARVLKDTRFEGAGEGPLRVYYEKFMKEHVEILNGIAKEWTYDSSDPKEAERKIEELVLLNVFIYGVSGWEKDKEYNADFLFMHLVTSSLFLSSIAVLLKPVSQEIFLRSYLTVSLSVWLTGGRPTFDTAGFFAADTFYPTSASPSRPANKTTLLSATSAKYKTPNPWFPIVQNALTIADDHVPKLQRALLHFAQLYGTREPGYLKDTELTSAELIDGTIFVRVAGLTDKRVVEIANTQTSIPGESMTWDSLRVF